MSNPNPIFNICVLTYNRGSVALELVRTILPDIDPDWELLVLDNASTTELDCYRQIAEMAVDEPRLRYLRHDHNTYFQGNYLACFQLSSAPFFMVVSDEDFPNPAMIRQMLPVLENHPNLGIMRGSMIPASGVKSRNSHVRPNLSLSAGVEALSAFSFSNNYFSGTIYNRLLASQYGLTERLAAGLDKYRVYPHLYMDLLMCARCDVISTQEVACFEGEEKLITFGGDPVLGVCRGSMSYDQPYSFGSRVDQFIVFRDALFEAVGLMGENFNIELFVKLYLRLCEKYFFLISTMNSAMYEKHHINPAELQESLMYVCGAAISLYPFLEPIETQIFEEIYKIYSRHRYPQAAEAGN